MKKVLSLFVLFLLSFVPKASMVWAVDVSNITVGTWNVGHFVAGVNCNGYDGSDASAKVVLWKNFVNSKKPDILCVQEWDYQDYFDKARTIKASDNILLPTYTSTAKNWLYQPIVSKWIMNGIYTNFPVNPNSRTTTILGDKVYYLMSETVTIDGHDLTVICGHIPYSTVNDYHAKALTLVKNELRKHKTFIFMGDTNASTAEQQDFLTEEGYHLANFVNNSWLKTTADNHSYDNIITSSDITISDVTATSSGLYKGDHYPLFCHLKIEWDSIVAQGGLDYKLDKASHTATILNSTNDMSSNLIIPASITVSGTTYSVTRIGMDAFKGNTTLNSVSIPASVTKIESHAFEGCSNLASITFHEGQDLQFSRRSFRNCTALTELNLPACYSDQFVTEGEYEGKNGEAAFAGCTSLTKVTFAKGSKLKHTYNYMFQSTTALQNINLEACTKLTNIAGWMFQSSGLKKVVLPASITVLEQKCFQNCKKLASVDFTKCTKLTLVHINSFQNCDLRMVDLSACTKIGTLREWSFAGNKNLKTVILPKSLRMIYGDTFNGDTSLENVVYLNEAFDWTQTSTVVLNKPTAFNKVARTVKAYYFEDNINVPENMNNSDGTIVKMIPVAPMEIIDGSGYATYYTSKSALALPDNIEVSIVPSVNDDVICLEPVEEILPAATAVLIKGETGKYYPVMRPDITTVAPANLLHGSDTETYTTGGDKYYKLAYGTDESNHSGRLAWYWCAENGGTFIIGAHQAWLALSNEQAQNTNCIFFMGDNLKGVNNLGYKPVVNKDSDIYDLQGRKVRGEKPKFYIMNGRKVIVTK